MREGAARTLTTQLFMSISISMSRPINTSRGCKISGVFGSFRELRTGLAGLLTYRNTPGRRALPPINSRLRLGSFINSLELHSTPVTEIRGRKLKYLRLRHKPTNNKEQFSLSERNEYPEWRDNKPLMQQHNAKHLIMQIRCTNTAGESSNISI